MARRGRPPKQAQNLFNNGDGITAAPTATNAVEDQQATLDDKIQEQATEESAQPSSKPPRMIVTERTEEELLKMVSEPMHVFPHGTEVRFSRHLKISVYAIAKNEAKFVKRWMESMKEADEIVVLDTGSTDDTVKQLASLGAKVETKIIRPWRFDVARNESMKLVSPDADILVCTDIDEILLPGWREKLESAWIAAFKRGERPTTAKYEYVWNFRADGSDGTKFTYEKVHAPGVALWTHPVHEILEYKSRKSCITVNGMRLEHHADPTKSRSQYLGLLEMSVRESPDDDRNTHYLGREYFFYSRWDDAIKTLTHHLSMPRAQWRAERAASMRYIAACYGKKGDSARQEAWLWRAVNEEPNQREAALELAELAYSNKDWQLLVRACERCLAVTKRNMSYLTKAEAWGSRPHDLYSVGLWYSGKRKEAIEANEEAMRLDPSNSRLKENDRVMRSILAK